MHEFSIAKSILERALAEAERHQGRRVLSLGVKLGKASHIEPESMEICLKAVAKGTIAEEARMDIECFGPMVSCKTCGHTSSPRDKSSICPACGRGNLELLTGEEVFLESMYVD